MSTLEAIAPLQRTLQLLTGRKWVTAGAFALVAGTGFASGGYFPASWGWPTLGAAWAAGLAVLARERNALSRLASAAATLLVALTGWTLLSVIWSIDVTQTALAAEQIAVYAAALLAALLWAGKRPERLLHGTWAAIVVVCCWSLLTRLVPDHFGEITAVGGDRLSLPIGYWNSLGLFAGMGALLALGLAARARTLAGRAVAGGSLPLLLTTLYFTYSRGAWLATGIGLVACLLLEPRRLQLATVALGVAPWSAIGLQLAYTSNALTTLGAPVPQMATQGHRLALWLVVLAIVSGATAAALRPLEPRLVLPERLRPVATGAAVLAVVASIGLVTASYGSPPTIARKTWDAFASSPVATGSSLNQRLYNFSGSGRVTQWRVAWREVKQYPWLGSGAGTFQGYWYQYRPDPSQIRNVHNLYLETLATLGPIGFLVLVGLLALPVAAAVRTRRRPLFAAALGAYVAYLVHAAVDWDWQIGAVTLAFLLCGAALLSAPRERKLRDPRARGLALATALVLGGTGLYTIATQIPMQRLSTAAAKGDWAAAESEARRASDLAPWSSEPWIQLGESELDSGRTPQAVVAFRRAVAAAPDEWLPWHDLARASTGAERARALAHARALNPLTP